MLFGKINQKNDIQIPIGAIKSGLMDKVKSILGNRNYIKFGVIEPNQSTN